MRRASHTRSLAWQRRRVFTDSGLLGRLGQDAGGQYAPIYAEELHWGCAGVALALGAATAVAAMIATQGTPEQFELWAPRCYGERGDPGVAAFALTEAHAGSDVSALRTLARRAGEDWVIDGSKTIINNAGIAHVTLVVAAVEPGLGPAGQATFLIEKGTKGMSASAPLPKLGVRASHTADLYLDDCRVPAAALLGGREALERRLARARTRAQSPGTPGQRSRALAATEMTRPLFAAGAVGIARAAYEWTLERLGELPAPERQFAEQVLADVASEVDAARLLVRRAAGLARAGVALSGGEGSMSKLPGGRERRMGDKRTDGPRRAARRSERLPTGKVASRREGVPNP